MFCGEVGKEWELGNGGTGSLWNWVVKFGEGEWGILGV